MDKKLIFVYNSDSGLFNGMADAVHKMFSSDTYTCKLRKLTCGKLFMKKEWSVYIKKLPIEAMLVHRDEFYKKYDSDHIEFPVIYLEDDKGLHVFLSSTAINNEKSLESLKKIIISKLNISYAK